MEHLSIWKAIAELRYRGHDVTGSGPLAVVLSCCRKVKLAATPLEANAIAAERCGPACSHIVAPDGRFHIVEELERPRPEIRRMMRTWGD